jgi:RNA polymerase sigma-70 factor (ECF subfamily)
MNRAEDGSDSAVRIPQAPSDEFVQLFTKWQRRLFLFILAQAPNPVEAEEILQETNLVIWRKSHTYREGTNFYAWGCRIAVLEVLKFRDRRRRQAVILSDAFVEAIAREAVFNVESLEERRRALLACLARLAPSDRDLIRRRYAPGETGKTVARQLGRPANSVYQSLSRIRRTLLDCIKRRLAAEAQA